MCEVEEQRTRSEPVERDEEVVPDRSVVTPGVQAADRVEPFAFTHQPDRLVEDAVVEGVGAEPLMMSDQEAGEHDGVDRRTGREHHHGQSRVAPPSRHRDFGVGGRFDIFRMGHRRGD